MFETSVPIARLKIPPQKNEKPIKEKEAMKHRNNARPKNHYCLILGRNTSNKSMFTFYNQLCSNDIEGKKPKKCRQIE